MKRDPEQDRAWLDYFIEHGELHPDEVAALEAEQKRFERNLKRRIARAGERAVAKARREMEASMEASQELYDRLRSEEPVLAEQDRLLAEHERHRKRVRRWAREHASVLALFVGRDHFHHTERDGPCWVCEGKALADQYEEINRGFARLDEAELEAARRRVRERCISERS